MNNNLARIICEKFVQTDRDEVVCEVENTGGVVMVNAFSNMAWAFDSWNDLFEHHVKECILEDFANIGKDCVKEYLGKDLYAWFRLEYEKEIRGRCS